MADETGRVEAAAEAIHDIECGCGGPTDPHYRDYAGRALAAADAHDRDYGIARIKLDDATGAITRVLYAAGDDQWAESVADRLLAVLREAATP